MRLTSLYFLAFLILGTPIFPLAAASPAVAEEIEIKIHDMAFTPKKLLAHVGDKVKWINEDFVNHTATGKNNEWSVILLAHGAGNVTLTEPGHIDYYCKYHPTMTGQIDVAP